MFRQFVADFVDLAGAPLEGFLYARLDTEGLAVGQAYIVVTKAAFPLVNGRAAGKLPTGAQIVLSLTGPYGATWRTVILPSGNTEINLAVLPDRTSILFGDAPAIGTAAADYAIDGGAADAIALVPGYFVDGGFIL